MFQFLEQLAISLWNALNSGNLKKRARELILGFLVRDGEVTRQPLGLSQTQRSMHIAVLGKTGSGKSSLLHLMAAQDIAAGRGFLYFDLHGDSTQFLLRNIAEQERERGEELHNKLIVIEPGSKQYSVGINPLDQGEPSFVRIAEFTRLLMQRWGLERFGARTDELLRNSLFVLSANKLTLLELAPLLTNDGFRAACLKQTQNPEVRQYFDQRFNKASDAMRATMREPILNKTSAFTADPSFRAIVGQQQSTFSIADCMDEGRWVIADLPKGRLGEQSLTLGRLIFTMAKNALFSRKQRKVFSIYVDEVQNYLAYDSGIETVLSEARKFGISIVSANQYLAQYPDEMRAAVLSVGTQVYFQLSPSDAGQVAQTLDAGKSLAERLKNLPQRHFVMKSGADRWQEGRVSNVTAPKITTTDLLRRTREAYGRPLAAIEAEISARHNGFNKKADELLNGWR